MSNLLALSGGDKEYLEKLVDVYIRQTNQSLIQLKEAVKMKNLKHVFEISHQMKSGIDSFNIESLKTEIREIETDARKGLYSERMETLVSHSEEILKKVIQEIRAEFYPDEDEFRPLYETQP
jgi:HPt (histidine-containing phosphotransfer) domain-containing protein